MNRIIQTLAAALLGIFAAAALVPQAAFATHYMGVDITYECLGTCTYRITHKTYYDCSGAATQSWLPIVNAPGNAPTSPSNFDFTITPTSPGCTFAPVVGAWTFVNWVEVTPICPTFSTQCGGGASSIAGVGEAAYYVDINLCNAPANCTQFLIEWETCCRNSIITSGADDAGIASGVTTINTGLSPCNSSPQFANPPVPYLCAGQPFTFNQGATDPNGDSLVYSLGPCYDANPAANPPTTFPTANAVPYNAGYSPTAPLGPTWSVTINSQTGDITVTPNPTGQTVIGVLCVYVDEYRNGVKIGTVGRDIQMTVIDCSQFGTNTLPTTVGVSNPSGTVTQTGAFTLDACLLAPLEFDIVMNDPNATQNFTMFWNQNIPGATFYNAANPAQQDTLTSSGVPPVGHFAWTPTNGGTYTFLITLLDDACPILGQNQYTVVIDVDTCQPYLGAEVIANCFTTEFTVLTGTNLDPPFTVTMTGNGGLSQGNYTATGTNLLFNFIHTYPTQGQYIYTANITDVNGVQLALTDTIDIINSTTANAGPDAVLCPGQVAVLGTPNNPAHQYSWVANASPNSLGFTSPQNVQQPTVSLNNTVPINTSYALTVSNPADGCQSTDNVAVQFLANPPSDFALPATICENATTTLVYTGVNAPTNTYTWSFGLGGTGTNAVANPPVSWVGAGVKDVSLTVASGACVGPTTTKQITVFGLPTSNFALSGSSCAGQPVQLTYTGNAGPNANFLWNFGGGSGITTDRNPSVVWNTPGTKFVTLTVTENGCPGQPVTQSFPVYPIPTADFTAPAQVCAFDPAQITYTGSSAANAIYNWTFDGGIVTSGANQGPFQVYWANGGVKNVILTVSENGCQSLPLTVPVNVQQIPQALIAPQAPQCFTGHAFNFNHIGTSAPSSYQWSFGNNSLPSASTSQAPAGITYNQPGIYDVVLHITKNGCVGTPDTLQVEVIEEPLPNFAISSLQTCSNVGLALAYTATPVSPNQTYFWTFQDGNPATSTLQVPGNITFANGGIKTITLSVGNKGCSKTASQTVTVVPSPIVDAGPALEYCEGDGGVQLQATVGGGTPPYLYAWTCNLPGAAGTCGLSSLVIEDPLANPNAAPTLAGPAAVRYYLSTTDVNGCKSLDSATVLVKAKPKMNAGADEYICQGQSATLQGGLAANNLAPLPVAYQWTPTVYLNNPSAPNPYCFKPDTTTIYTLRGISVNGCSSDANTLDPLATMVVYVKPLPVVNAGPDKEICKGQNIALNGLATGAGPTYTYVWTPATAPGNIANPAITNPTAAPDFTTTYTFGVFSNGCYNSDSVTVTVHQLPTIDVTGDSSVCRYDSIQNIVCTSNQADVAWKWVPSTGVSDPSSDRPRLSPATTTTYAITATNAGTGCVSAAKNFTVTVFATPLSSITTNDTTLCGGAAHTLKGTHSFAPPAPGTPALYQWSPGAGIVGASTTPNITVQPDTTTRYVLTVTNPLKNCESRDTVTVFAYPGLTDIGVSADTSVICGGDAVVLSASGGKGSTNYAWSPAGSLDDPSAGTVVATPASTTTYTLTATEGDCAAVRAVTITVHPLPVPAFLHTVNDGCAGLEVRFESQGLAQNTIAWAWDFGDGSPVWNAPDAVHRYDSAGTYAAVLRAYGLGGCWASDTVYVTALPRASAAFASNPGTGGPALLLPSAGVQFTDLSTAAVGWQWEFGDGATSAERHPVHAYTAAGSYSVRLTATDARGCTDTATRGPIVVEVPGAVTENVFTPNGDGVNERFNILYEGTEAFGLSVFDRWGRLVFESDSPVEGWDGTQPGGAPAPAGVYFYLLTFGAKTLRGEVTLLR